MRYLLGISGGVGCFPAFGLNTGTVFSIVITEFETFGSTEGNQGKDENPVLDMRKWITRHTARLQSAGQDSMRTFIPLNRGMTGEQRFFRTFVPLSRLRTPSFTLKKGNNGTNVQTLLQIRQNHGNKGINVRQHNTLFPAQKSRMPKVSGPPVIFCFSFYKGVDSAQNESIALGTTTQYLLNCFWNI